MSAAMVSNIFAGTRRRHRRLPLRVPMRFRRTDGSGQEYEGMSTDVSIGGLGAEVNANFAIGEILDCCFECAEYDSSSYRARVIYRNKRHYGLYLLR